MKKLFPILGLTLLCCSAMAQVSQWSQLTPADAGRTYNKLIYTKLNSIAEQPMLFSMGFTAHAQTGGSFPTVTPSFTRTRAFVNAPPFSSPVAELAGFRATGCDYQTDPVSDQYLDESWLAGQQLNGSLQADYRIGAIYKRIAGVTDGTPGYALVRSATGYPYNGMAINKKFGGTGVCAVGLNATTNSNQKAVISGSTDNGSTWTDYTHQTTNFSILHAVKWSSEDVAFAVGGIGDTPHNNTVNFTPLLLKTTDEAVTWQEIDVNISGLSDFYNLFILDPSNIWIVGGNGKIIRSDDGGSTWTEQTSGTTQRLQSVFFTDNQKGWVVGAAGTVLMTTDGGQNWSNSAISTSSLLTDIAFISETSGVIQASNGETFFYSPCVAAPAGTDVRTACSTLTWIDGVTYTSNNNTATHYLVSASGCDSIVTLNLTVGGLPPIAVSAQEELCNGRSYQFGTQTISTEGEYIETFTTINGCDSIVTLTVTFSQSLGCAWENVPGARLTNISCGSTSLVVGCDADGFGWHLNTGTDVLVQAPANQNITNVSMCADGTLFFIGTNGLVYRGLNFSGTIAGNYTSGVVSNMSAQNANYAVGAVSGATGPNIYRYNGSTWSLLPGGGNLDKVAVGDDGTTYGVYAANNSIYTHNGSTWAGAAGTLSHVAVANANMIVGVSGGDLVRKVGTTFSLTDLPRPNGAAIIDADIADDGTIYVLTDEATDNVYRTTWDLLTAPIVTRVNEASASNMSIYPNPFNTEFVIETTALTTISVMNAMGQVVLSRTINGRTSIDAATLPTGIYFVREETSGVVMKLVKN